MKEPEKKQMKKTSNRRTGSSRERIKRLEKHKKRHDGRPA